MGKLYYRNENGEYVPMSIGGITIASAPDLRDIGKQIISGKIKRIILLGDSSTDGEGGSGYVASESGKQSVNYNGYCWANLLKKFLGNRYGVQVENYGFRGSAASHQVEQILPHLAKDTFVFWLSGANNRTSDELFEDYSINIATYINQVANASAGLLMMTNAPTTESADSWEPYTTSDMRDALIKNIPNGIMCVDMHDAYIDRCRAKGITVNSTMADWYHCNDTGYELMFHIVMDAIGIPTNPYADYSSDGDWWNGMELLIDTGTDEIRIQETLEATGKTNNESGFWDSNPVAVPIIMFCNPHPTADGGRATRFTGQTLRKIRFNGVGLVTGSLTFGIVDIMTYNNGNDPVLENPVTLQMSEDGIIDFGESGYTIPANYTFGFGISTDTARVCIVEDSRLDNKKIALTSSMWKTGKTVRFAPCAAFYKKC